DGFCWPFRKFRATLESSGPCSGEDQRPVQGTKAPGGGAIAMVVVVVLGMHRSGTSCLTRMLQQAGMFLGSDLMDVLACSNLEGHAEANEAVRINDRILERGGGAWDRVPATLCGDDDTASRMRAFLLTFDGHPVAGWKDPRTTLTWPLWKPHLPRY